MYAHMYRMQEIHYSTWDHTLLIAIKNNSLQVKLFIDIHNFSVT